jgi:hypothetical protein
MKKLLLLISLTLSLAISAEEMIPLSKYVKENPKYRDFKSDLSSSNYFSSRCSAIISKAENRAKQDSKYLDAAKTFKRVGEVYDQANFITAELSGISIEASLDRYKAFLGYYEKATMESWKLNNDMFAGVLGEDLNICTSNFKYFDSFTSKNNAAFK